MGTAVATTVYTRFFTTMQILPLLLPEQVFRTTILRGDCHPTRHVDKLLPFLSAGMIWQGQRASTGCELLLAWVLPNLSLRSLSLSPLSLSHTFPFLPFSISLGERSLYSLFWSVIPEVIFDFLREVGVCYKIWSVSRKCLCGVF